MSSRTQPDTLTPVQLLGEGITRLRCRSFSFLIREGTRWTVFLITYLRTDGQWRGYFMFRTAAEGLEQSEIRTADLFVEGSEEEVDARARGLGRPLVLSLLESALDTHQRRQGYSPDLQRLFRELLGRHMADRKAGQLTVGDPAPASLDELHSLYETYRLDQVSQLIGLMEPVDFREMVEVFLDGRRIDFQARDRLQLAMSVVQELERRLPLPPFERWVEDYLAHGEEYRRYSGEVHGEEQQP
ncbi:MAG: hypothetical protein ACREMQ_09380 [Longimicrobiales bacterium]